MKSQLALLGLGAMGTELGRAWLAAGHPLTVWNRTPGRAEPFAAAGAAVAPTAADAVAAADLVMVCLLDDDSVAETLAAADLTGKDLVNLTTSTPAEARTRSAWVAGRGARYLDGGIMAVPPMIGVPDSGAYVFYSGSRELFEARRDVLAVPAATTYVGEDPGMAALYDVALLSAMSGMFAGILHAFALVRREDVPLAEFTPLLAGWLSAMTASAYGIAAHLESGDYTKDVTSNLAMMVRGDATLRRTAEEQGVSPELLTPLMALMRRRLDDGHGDEDATGVIDLLTR